MLLFIHACEISAPISEGPSILLPSSPYQACQDNYIFMAVLLYYNLEHSVSLHKEAFSPHFFLIQVDFHHSVKAYLKDFNNTFAKIDSTYPRISHDLQSSRTIRLLHRSLNCSKSCLEMGNLCGGEVEIIFLFIALQFSIYIPR